MLAFVSLKLLPKKGQIDVAIDSLSGSYLLLFVCLQFVVFFVHPKQPLTKFSSNTLPVRVPFSCIQKS
jgi:hypothetical protein